MTYAHVDDSGRRGTRQTRRVLTDVEIAERRSYTREYVAKERKRIDADQRIVEQRARDERRRTRRW